MEGLIDNIQTQTMIFHLTPSVASTTPHHCYSSSFLSLVSKC